MPCLADPGYEPTLGERLFGASAGIVETTGYPIMEAVERTIWNFFLALIPLSAGFLAWAHMFAPPESPTDTGTWTSTQGTPSPSSTPKRC